MPVPSAPPPGHAEIAGAGIGGLTLAAALARRGWSVRLHERDDAVRAFGSGIYLWDNGLAVLDELGVLDAVTRGAHHGRAIISRDRTGRELARVPINRPGATRVLTVLRERLIAGLLAAARDAGVQVVTSSRVVGLDPGGRLHLADGVSVAADLVVAADGVGSRLRDGLGLLRRRRRTGQVCARVLIDRSPRLVPDEDADDYVEHLSGRRFLLYTPSSAEQAYVALVCPEGDVAARGTPVPVDTWAASFPAAASLVAALRGLEPRWDPFERVELTAWSHGRAAVLGDAAHAQPPYLGQGGGCAMMSAAGLARAVTALGVDAGLPAWERAERPLIAHTQRFSHGVGMLNDVPDAPRTLLLGALGRSRAFGRSRLRAAMRYAGEQRVG